MSRNAMLAGRLAVPLMVLSILQFVRATVITGSVGSRRGQGQAAQWRASAARFGRSSAYAGPVAAQQATTTGNQSPAVVAGGNVARIIGCDNAASTNTSAGFRRRMRRLLLLTSLSLLAGTYAIAPAYAQGYGNQPPGYKASPPPAPYTGSNQPAPGYKEPTPQAPYAGAKDPLWGPAEQQRELWHA